ncbi:hypothetical protein E4099_01240 [Streptomyces palmae]|uniref:Uncharacterized protein n=1 Tax=Streptomyces palmae TaxID=1701085 RepID=A0A4Z0HGA4_9ACTN|nr:hypothetical protein E4099_01240 [Streptomyces palmae]
MPPRVHGCQRPWNLINDRLRLSAPWDGHRRWSGSIDSTPGEGGIPMDQISVRMVLLLLVGGLTAFAVLHHPGLGAAIAVATAVVALLHELMARE